jgi:hypothetical protein
LGGEGKTEKAAWLVHLDKLGDRALTCRGVGAMSWVLVGGGVVLRKTNLLAAVHLWRHGRGQTTLSFR